MPTLVLASGRTGSHTKHHDALLTTDSVVAVKHVRADVRFVENEGGAHDLALSPSPARERYLAAVTDWLRERIPPGP